MTSKTISITKQVYEELAKTKSPRESFSEEITKLLRRKGQAFCELKQLECNPSISISRLADIDRKGERLTVLSNAYNCLHAFPQLTDHYLFCQKFKKRHILPSKPYAKFAKHENPLPALREYCRMRYEQFKPTIVKWLDSPVVQKLVEQYKEAVEIKRIAEQQVKAVVTA